MGRRRQYVQRVQIGFTAEIKRRVSELIGEFQTPYQYFIEDLIIKAYDHKHQQRDKRFKPHPSMVRTETEPVESTELEGDEEYPEKDPFTKFLNAVLDVVPTEDQQDEHGTKLAYLSQNDLKIWLYKKAEEYGVPIPGREPTPTQQRRQEEEANKIKAHDEKWEENEKQSRELRKIKAFRWRMSKNPQLKKRKIWGDIRIVPPHLISKYSADPNVKILKTSRDLRQAQEELKEIFEWVAQKEKEYDTKYGEGTPERILHWNKEIDPE